MKYKLPGKYLENNEPWMANSCLPLVQQAIGFVDIPLK
jgi:hypothetical protein